MAFGARVIGIGTAKMIVDCWLNAKFKGGRHQERVNMIMEIEDSLTKIRKKRRECTF